MKERKYYIYIATNKNNKVLYIGVTKGLLKRISEHKSGKHPNSFTRRYNINKLVYYEIFDNINKAIFREKQLKGGSRKKKIELIESINTEWRDLYEDML